MAQTENDIRKKTRGLFDDLSVAQVTAGALAAVTSMLLASQIGIAGSVIGVAVGSVVATVTSQLYKKFLSASAEKLHDLRPGSECADDATAPLADATSETGNQVTAVLTQDDAGATRVLEGVSSPTSATSLCSRTPRIGDANANVGQKVLLERAARKRRAVVQRRVIAIAMASALVAVAVSAAVINLATTGQGIGTKTASFTSVDTQSQSTDTSSSSGSADVSTPAPSTSAPSSNESSSQDSSGTSSNDSSSTSKDSSSSQDSSSSSQDTTSGGTGASDGTSSGSGQSDTGSSDSSTTTPESGKTETDGSGDSSGSSSGTSSGTSTGSTAQSTTGTSSAARA